MTARASAWALALALVACGADDIDAASFDVGRGGHGSHSANDAEAPGEDAGLEDAGELPEVGNGGAGGFGGGDVSPDAGDEVDAGEDAEPIADSGIGDASPDAVEDSGPVGPPYDNPNVRCLVKNGNGTTEYRCDGLYAMRWTMRYRGPDGVLHRCTGAPDDRDTHRPACPPGNECRVYPQDKPTLWGECAP